MPTNLLLSVSVKYWQEFQDTLAKVMDANIYIFDINGGSFSRFSLPVELCQEVNKGRELRNEKCISFYKSALASLEDKDIVTCPYGIKLCAYRLGSYAQKIGFLVVAPTRLRTQVGLEEENTFVSKANSIYQTINEVLKAILEKNLLGLRRLELNSIYEISRLMTSIVELDKVLDLITNSLIIIYKAELCVVGLREGDKIKVAQAKGEHAQPLIGREWPLVHPLMEQVFSKVEPSFLSLEELRPLPGFAGVEVTPGAEILIYPLWTALGAVGLLGIVAPVSMDDNGDKNLQIYANFAAVALSNATLIRRLEREAETDVLTGFFNKRALRNILANELERTVRYGTPLSVIFLDIDDFKAYNDAFGHLSGDVVLEKTAEIIRNSIRTVDIAGRYGGEEFVIILPGTNKEGAVRVAERIRKSIETFPFPHRRITASIGIASAQKDDSIDLLLARADQACYRAKKEGKNRFCLNLP
ncbi:GGDEF domain-containing protein [Calderihabitans maritimus]|uniref:Diguanylate cyclase n=1 Tax=Calderihabitans maritimus TaxID=1246530 RepID=A0A1Z5HPB1_9FIRM|nr:sensor domain-containing diguanylate cyclase [Calderihabitans maritimus]GAW91366.1 diguanylate cyclase [Calderihabitans maritimus]